MSDWDRFKKTYNPWGVKIPEGVGKIKIQTREGEVVAEPGDYLMRDSKGYLYPIAEDELKRVYVKMEEEDYG
jgi:hypothetical protein